MGGDATDERAGVLELVGAGGSVLEINLLGLGLYGLARFNAVPVSSTHLELTDKVVARAYCLRLKYQFSGQNS